MEELDKVLSFADNMATDFVYKTRSKLANLTKKPDNKQSGFKKLKLKEAYLKRKAILFKYLESAKFVRLKNKWSFVLGVLAVLAHIFILGRYPHDLYYDFHAIF